MAIYNTGSDAANTNVRAFLTKIGEFYLGHTFDTGSGKGKEIWSRIKSETFRNMCAFCNEHADSLTIEHLVMFNRSQCGLHHPGNIVPCCKSCNKRKRDPNTKVFLDWTEHLQEVCQDQGARIDELSKRKQRITYPINNEGYPNFTEDEINALRAVSENLYRNTTSGLEGALNLFKSIDDTLLRKRS